MSHRHERLQGLGLAVLVLLGAAPAAAYNRSPSNWNPRDLPIHYSINMSSVPRDLGMSTGVSAITSGFATWSAPACTTWRTTNDGNTTTTAGSTSDGENSILWLSGSWPSEYGAVDSTIGITTPVWTVGGYVIDADIQFNNVGFRWSTNGLGGTVDAQSIATHEEGHFLGLNHPPAMSSVMYASYSSGLKRTLTSDDIAGVCAIYPSGVSMGGVDAGPPVTMGDRCNAFTSCGGCTPNAGCGWCSDSNTCQSGGSSGSSTCGGASWTWLPSDCGGGGTTTDPCSENHTCNTCTPVSGCGWCGASSQCVSGSESGPLSGSCGGSYAWLQSECMDNSAGTAAFGEPCESPRDCQSGGFCISLASGGGNAFCSAACADDCTCPRGYRCATGRLRVCVPGTNTCATGPGDDDAGPDDPASTDAGTTTSLDGSTGGGGGRSGITNTCACSVPGAGSTVPPGTSVAMSALAALALTTVVTRRRRRSLRRP